MSRIRMGESTNWQFIRYVVVGTLNSLVGLTVILVLRLMLDVNLTLANLLGYGVGLIISFTLNGFWTFQRKRLSSLNLLLFILLVVIAFLCNMLILNYLNTSGFSYVFAQTAGAISYSLVLFFGMKYVVYRFGPEGQQT